MILTRSRRLRRGAPHRVGAPSRHDREAIASVVTRMRRRLSVAAQGTADSVAPSAAGLYPPGTVGDPLHLTLSVHPLPEKRTPRAGPPPQCRPFGEERFLQVAQTDGWGVPRLAREMLSLSRKRAAFLRQAEIQGTAGDTMARLEEILRCPSCGVRIRGYPAHYLSRRAVVCPVCRAEAPLSVEDRLRLKRLAAGGAGSATPDLESRQVEEG